MKVGLIAYITKPNERLDIFMDSKTGLVRVNGIETTLEGYDSMRWVLSADEETLKIEYKGADLNVMLADLGKITGLVRKAGLEIADSQLAVTFKNAKVSTSSI